VDYETTLVLALEVSDKSWVLAAHVPGSGHVKAKQVIAPNTDALGAAIERYRGRAAASGRTVERVILVYEAGYAGFWLARWLKALGIEVHVIQPSSVPVERKKRRAKSDTIDAELLLRTLLAWLRGEPRVCSMVPVPDEAQEDVRRQSREREELLRERVSLTNRIGAVKGLATPVPCCDCAEGGPVVPPVHRVAAEGRVLAWATAVPGPTVQPIRAAPGGAQLPGGSDLRFNGQSTICPLKVMLLRIGRQVAALATSPNQGAASTARSVTSARAKIGPPCVRIRRSISANKR
jgi:hypothetical protein